MEKRQYMTGQIRGHVGLAADRSTGMELSEKINCRQDPLWIYSINVDEGVPGGDVGVFSSKSRMEVYFNMLSPEVSISISQMNEKCMTGKMSLGASKHRIQARRKRKKKYIIN